MKSLLGNVHESWRELLEESLHSLDNDYQDTLLHTSDWLPGNPRLFSAFSLPLSEVNYILLGESPYPRTGSANGFAFWDAAVEELWSPTGLSKPVNRATSLRNFIKMLLLARGDLSNNFSQEAIARLDKQYFIKTARGLFNNMLDKGFLLLNATLVYRKDKVSLDAKEWRPFMQCLLRLIAVKRPALRLILFGKVAKMYENLTALPTLTAEHPYNISFIANPAVIDFFKPLNLLAPNEQLF